MKEIIGELEKIIGSFMVASKKGGCSGHLDRLSAHQFKLGSGNLNFKLVVVALLLSF